MRNLKMLGLAAIAAGALTAIAGVGSAAATELTCEPGVMCPAGTEMHGQSEGHVVLDSPIGEIKCNVALEGKTSNTGGPSETVFGTGLVSTITNCTDGAVIQVLQKGTVEVHTDPNDPSGASGNGTLTSTGTRVTVELFGAHCIFETNATDAGTITGSTATKGKATIDLSVRVPRVGGRSGALCGSTAPATGSGVIESPTFLDIH
jgi:hypothetical protein